MLIQMNTLQQAHSLLVIGLSPKEKLSSEKGTNLCLWHASTILSNTANLDIELQVHLWRQETKTPELLQL